MQLIMCEIEVLQDRLGCPCYSVDEGGEGESTFILSFLGCHLVDFCFSYMEEKFH